MLDKLRKKLNNSASLGKTLARTQQHHFSHFAEPREFDLRSLNESRQESKKRGKKSMLSTPAHRAVPANICIGDSLAQIQQNRQKCSRVGQDVHTATVDKNLRVNKMYKELHHFSICVDELKWLLTEGDLLIRAYLAQASLIAPNSPHTIDVANIAQEFRSLVLRFAHIEQNKLVGIEDYLNLIRLQGMSGTVYGQQKANPQRNQLQTYPEENMSMQLKERVSGNSTFLQTRHFSVPLKENINSTNISQFDNIKILKSQATKHKSANTNKKAVAHQSVQVQHEREDNEKEQIYNRLRAQQEKIEEMSDEIEMLKEEIGNAERKMAKHKVASSKSISKFSEILKALMGNLTQQQKEFELLKMAQSISNWEKMIEEDHHQAKYRQIYGDANAMQDEKTEKLQEIIQLQYEINNLQAQSKYLHDRTAVGQEKAESSNDLYRMLAVQACTLEQLCNF